MDYSRKISERLWNMPDKGELEQIVMIHLSNGVLVISQMLSKLFILAKMLS